MFRFVIAKYFKYQTTQKKKSEIIVDVTSWNSIYVRIKSEFWLRNFFWICYNQNHKVRMINSVIYGSAQFLTKYFSDEIYRIIHKLEKHLFMTNFSFIILLNYKYSVFR